MKILYNLFFWLFFFAIYNVNSQPLGFVQSECGIISNPHYWYENYSVGSHGSGVKLYHDGKIILEDHWDSDWVLGQELNLIDDTTGFFIYYIGPNTAFYVFKIINDNVIRIGITPGDYSSSYDFFIISRHSVYFVSHPNGPVFFISQFSDLKPEKDLVYDVIMNSDTTFLDTIQGLTFCPELNKLNYLYYKSPDTLIFTIKFQIDSLESTPEYNELKYKIIPNPAKDFISINRPLNQGDVSLSIYDNLSRLRKFQKLAHDNEQKINISDLEPGLYLVIIDNSTMRKVNKLIKL